MAASPMICTTLRKRALTGVSAVALAIMVGQGPALADGHERPSWLMLEFGYDIYAGDEQGWTEIPGQIVRDIEPDDGLHGAVGFVTPWQDSAYDIGIFARFGGSFNEDSSQTRTPTATVGPFASAPYNILGGTTYTGFSSASVDHEEKHVIVDFEARRDIGMGGGIDVTAKAGFRFAYFDAETDTNFSRISPTLGGLSEERNSTFIGFGPKLGFDAVVPMSGSMQFDFSGDASLLFGDRERRVEATGTGALAGLSVTDDDHSFRVVPTLGGTAGISFTPEGLGGMKFTVGFKAEAFFNVYDQRVKFDPGGGNGRGEKNAHRFQFGPFARITIPLDGL